MSHTFPHKYPIPNDLIEGIDSRIRVASMPKMISTSNMLIPISNRLNRTSHFNWLSESFNLEFFIAAVLLEMKLPFILVLTRSSPFAKDGFIKYGLLYTNNYQPRFAGAGNWIVLLIYFKLLLQ